jgi:DmsE family decaheme c-type cytochrome
MKSRGLELAILSLALLVVIRLGSGGLPAHAAEPCDSESCMICHEEQGKASMMSIHWEAANPDGEALGCASCHGPSEEHCEAPEAAGPTMAFRETDPIRARLDACLGCHAAHETGFNFKHSPHVKGGVTCESCHRPHIYATNDKLVAKKTSMVCVGCHQEKLAASLLNERHRMLEEMVGCVDCHDQHGPSDRSQLGGFKQEMCYRCHTDKQGPFLYEHLAVRIERCSECHDPHGSVNRHLLHYQNVADLCYSCHVEVPSFHLRFAGETQCTNCHVAIHGSNLHPAFLD